MRMVLRSESFRVFLIWNLECVSERVDDDACETLISLNKSSSAYSFLPIHNQPALISQPPTLKIFPSKFNIHCDSRQFKNRISFQGCCLTTLTLSQTQESSSCRIRLKVCNTALECWNVVSDFRSTANAVCLYGEGCQVVTAVQTEPEIPLKPAHWTAVIISRDFHHERWTCRLSAVDGSCEYVSTQSESDRSQAHMAHNCGNRHEALEALLRKTEMLVAEKLELSSPHSTPAEEW